MAIPLIIGLVGAAVSLAGSLYASAAQQKMIAEQTQASKKAENARQQQMQLDAAHRRRQAVREALMARSMSLAVGSSQGAQYGSGVVSAMGQATAMGAENQQVTTSTEVLGGRVFSANREYFEATKRGQGQMAIGQGIAAIGGAISSNAGAISQIGTYFGSRPAGSTLNSGVSS